MHDVNCQSDFDWFLIRVILMMYLTPSHFLISKKCEKLSFNNSSFLRRREVGSKIRGIIYRDFFLKRSKTKVHDVWAQCVPTRGGQRYAVFHPFRPLSQRPEVVLGSRTPIFLISSTSSTTCPIQIFFENFQKQASYFNLPFPDQCLFCT